MTAPDPLPLVHLDAETRRILREAGIERLELRLSKAPATPTPTYRRAPVDPDLDRAVGDFLAGEAERLSAVPREVAAIALQIALLDRFRVPAGAKAIAIFMHAVWTDERTDRFGPAANVHTLRRWRASRRDPEAALTSATAHRRDGCPSSVAAPAHPSERTVGAACGMDRPR